jgi:hypothetical protein
MGNGWAKNETDSEPRIRDEKKVERGGPMATQACGAPRRWPAGPWCVSCAPAALGRVTRRAAVLVVRVDWREPWCPRPCQTTEPKP